MRSGRVDIEVIWGKFSFFLAFIEVTESLLEILNSKLFKVCVDKIVFMALNLNLNVAKIGQQIVNFLIVDFHVWDFNFCGNVLS